MSTITPNLITNCPSCNAELPLGALACPACHTLIYAIRLDQLSRDARTLEVKSRFSEARELWEVSLTLLPHDSTQAAWVKEHISQLNNAHLAAQTQPSAAPSHQWAKKFGPLAPILILLVKAKGLLLAIFKLKFLFSFFTFIVLYVAIFGWRYGVGIALSILIHEMGHFIDVKRRGLSAEMPVFLPGLGAYVKWNAMGVTRRQIAQISLAGPLAGWIAAAVCAVLYVQTQDPLWAALARTGAILNVLNLIPIWVLDGGQAVRALGQIERIALLAASLALWLYFGEVIFALVAAGAVYQLFFAKDKPVQEDWSILVYYLAVLTALALVLHAAPASIVPNHPIR